MQSVETSYLHVRSTSVVSVVETGIFVDPVLTFVVFVNPGDWASGSGGTEVWRCT